MQGCPASAFFNNAIDPFLASFDKALRSRHAGIVRACADDLGIVLKRKHLKLVHPIFNDCKSHAGLALKPPKCVLVPLCVFSQEVHDQVCKWVAHHLPDWKLFKVKPLAKLLGFFIGPQAGTKMWDGPLTKYKGRINDIKRGSASIALNCHTYNSRIVPVFSYVSQLVPLPNTFHELFGMCSAIKAPNASRESDYYALHKIGGLSLDQYPLRVPLHCLEPLLLLLPLGPSGYSN